MRFCCALLVREGMVFPRLAPTRRPVLPLLRHADAAGIPRRWLTGFPEHYAQTADGGTCTQPTATIARLAMARANGGLDDGCGAELAANPHEI